MPGGDEPRSYYVGVDVGTGSVRAALVDQRGTLLAFADQPINQWEPQFNHHEQSSEDIWAACCVVSKKVVQGVSLHQIRGLGFDATCSLVVLDKQFRPLPVNHEGDSHRNIIMWLDHRAVSQVHRINETKHSVLQYVGGVMSVEMQAPKLLWLKENLRETCWDKAGHFFDLPDFLSWKATGVTARNCTTKEANSRFCGIPEDSIREAQAEITVHVHILSLCSLVCKWTYSAEKGWDDSFWKMVGLEDLITDNYSKIGNQVLPPGASLGSGLTPEAAKDLGLPPGIAVAASLIDAHAGGLGVIGADVKGHGLACEGQPVTSRLAVICGTSSCHMGISKNPIFVPGVWGPYFSAMVPGFWLNEGGQSVTGKLIDHMVQGHAAFPELQAKATARGQSVYAYLNSHLDLIKKAQPVGFLTVDLHVWPDFHGNRSPLADLTLKGMVTGLKLSQDLDDLAILYLATVQAIAFGTRLIIEAMESAGHSISTLFLCGGLSKNPLFVQMHADITGMPVVLSQEVESVLVGAAVLGACASGDFASVQEAMAKMSKVGKVVFPSHEDKRYYDKKYQVFLKLVEHQKEYAAIMKGD
ncbi:FGGY carbohydrate kinase domain-containing protein isoform X1 [Bubalus bubalis]|uniref:FGGY carbohydrate kinase domain-containing protein isoform X1 n=3 Tax=Bubalus bubalis TaxID=89462 RepID=UPI001D11A89B|nr:FGGY carbohydrate kinase domain-containing protein isoform X1 [Bubalus bubalis]XP_044800852.1 FGGY carbohydrate kinase domain-containing protein isoform X1 [Bubalus bubalis]XP_044800853.1 FGGY carbohydrate kinase domain-containing protein isoform X1 [Bubalus bubalis]XP_044800854.1 FGGY carbohydrate kinase domain-containing protein isoform X1 [Bubalus bubalis]XP_044800855.1 FGGY carbohydrate kinase domain-containing protein isoform X1 [Bubalus bubalis]XP_044800856.1 FGGY carbohydrate kinase 